MNSHVTICVSFCENVMSRRTIILKLTHLVSDLLSRVHTNTFLMKNKKLSFNVSMVTIFSPVVYTFHKKALHISAAVIFF